MQPACRMHSSCAPRAWAEGLLRMHCINIQLRRSCSLHKAGHFPPGGAEPQRRNSAPPGRGPAEHAAQLAAGAGALCATAQRDRADWQVSGRKLIGQSDSTPPGGCPGFQAERCCLASMKCGGCFPLPPGKLIASTSSSRSPPMLCTLLCTFVQRRVSGRHQGARAVWAGDGCPHHQRGG